MAFCLAGPALLAKPRVFVFTDINIDAGDPDDRQSLVHLLWYADELEIVGVVPDRWDARGLEACHLVVDAYAADFERHDWERKGYPAPETIKNRISPDRDHAMEAFAKAVLSSEEPLWVLVWGAMGNVGRALQKWPEASARVRLVTIGTGLMFEPDREHLPAGWKRTEPCRQMNWNGAGRNEIYQDPRFHEMWWLEINWTYNGMFSGEQPKEMFEKLSHFGALGRHLQDVTKNEPWARYFRVGDTPSVLYVIDPRREQDDPTRSSWAGQFKRALPEERPHYYTDDHGPHEWDYKDPCKTWENHASVHAYSRATLEEERPAMYQALLDKLARVYGERND